MALADYLVAAVLIEGRPVAEVAAEHGVSRSWLYELLARYRDHGDDGLRPRSRRPHHSPTRTPAAVEDEILRWRKRLTDQGLDAGSATIHAHLSRTGGPVPSEATIWRILARRGFIAPQPAKRPRSSYTRFAADLPNERWQTDITHWRLANGRTVEIMNVIDDHSRLLLASVAATVFDGTRVLGTFKNATRSYGEPASLLTDNGGVFTAKAVGGHNALETHLAARGIKAIHSRPYHPQTCGKVERFHQTVKRFLAAQPPAATFAELQAQLDEFRDRYNHHRPHRALGRQIPAEVWAASPKSGPATHPLTAPTVIHRGIVHTNGMVSAGHHRLVMTHTHLAGAAATVITTGLDCHVFVDARLVRHLTLDPTRRVQPLGVRPRHHSPTP
jgi:transposase InsO family protein